jgi:ribosomal protein L25 (general stress protein Ctc)
VSRKNREQYSVTTTEGSAIRYTHRAHWWSKPVVTHGFTGQIRRNGEIISIVFGATREAVKQEAHRRVQMYRDIRKAQENATLDWL